MLNGDSAHSIRDSPVIVAAATTPVTHHRPEKKAFPLALYHLHNINMMNFSKNVTLFLKKIKKTAEKKICHLKTNN